MSSCRTSETLPHRKKISTLNQKDCNRKVTRKMKAHHVHCLKQKNRTTSSATNFVPTRPHTNFRDASKQPHFLPANKNAYLDACSCNTEISPRKWNQLFVAPVTLESSKKKHISGLGNLRLCQNHCWRPRS